MPLNGGHSVVLTVLPLQGEVAAEQAEGAPQKSLPSQPHGHRARTGWMPDGHPKNRDTTA